MAPKKAPTLTGILALAEGIEETPSNYATRRELIRDLKARIAAEPAS
ncbi:hypothetical protein [Arthrobacter sp. efr-133-TYG-118]|nr:hypothetical protein [Arthrobacter sp. efr-133-TYG-118]